MNDWIPHHRGFQKECPVCDALFIGRKNKIYCSDICKARYHNDLLAQRRSEENRHTSSLLKNIQILQEAMMYTTENVITVPMNTLKSKGFDSKAPTKRAVKDDQNWRIYGDYQIHINENAQCVDIQLNTTK